ncbi:hypothetical protein ABI59_17290 [Acidobacteria bacterium Mor1]|nr:hypothetical protein ABI59_17290 [Acidobacteria bacterium Mor1]
MFRMNGLRIALFGAALFGLALNASADWPGFRGPDTSGSVPGGRLLGDRSSLEIGWKVPIGSGYSSPAVVGNRVVVMFHGDEHDFVGAFDVESGEELWRHGLGKPYDGHDGSHDGPIATPLIAGDHVFGLGGWGELFAVKLADGSPVWSTHLADDHGGRKPHYGFSTSPIMVDGVLIVEIGAEDKAIAGFNPKSGEMLWSTGSGKVEYQSPIAAVIDGKPMVVAVSSTHLYGLEAQSGKTLWSHEHGGDERAMGGASMVPVPAGDGRLFLMNKQDSSSMVQVKADKELDYKVDELWSSNALKSSYVTPVYHDGHLYGISGRVLTCIDAGSGERKWRSREPGDGFITVIGDQLVVMTKPGTLHVAKASPDGYQELASVRLFPEDEHSWSETAFSGKHLYARSMGELARIDVAAAATAAVIENEYAWLGQTEFGAFLQEVQQAGDKQAVVDAFMAKQSSFPIIEGPDLAHFVFQGDAEDVGIVSDLIGFRREDPMVKVDGTDLFFYSARLEPDAAVSYGFIEAYADQPGPDPRNEHKSSGLFGDVSRLTMPAWDAPAHTAEAPAGRQGTLESVTWERTVTRQVDGEEKEEKQSREVKVYLPAGFSAGADKRYPTLYYANGEAALDTGMMKNTLDNLIGESMEAAIVVFVLPAEEGGRADPPPALLEMLTKEIVPMIDEKFPTMAEAGHRGIAGVSGGGTAALLGGINHPDVFSRVGSQSAQLFSVPIWDMLKTAEEQPMLVYMNWGRYDLRSPHEAWDMGANNARAWDAMRDKGYSPAGGEVPEGFGWAIWSGRTDDMLQALFPRM